MLPRLRREPPIRVTTSLRATEPELARAAQLSERLGWPLRPRERLRLDDGALTYVVARNRERLDGGGESLFVHPGMLAAKLNFRDVHPLSQALAGARTLLDGTLGLAGDALHAAALGLEVTGVEASPALFSLAEEGLPRLARDPVAGPAAARIRALHGRAELVLAGFPDDHFDAVMLDPMFRRPAAAQPGFSLLRAVALTEPLSPELLAQARRVGRRVVIKTPNWGPPPCPDAQKIGGRGAWWWVLS